MAEPVADLEIRLMGEVAPFTTAMERVATSGNAAATAAERAEKASVSLGQASATAGTGVQRLAEQQLRAGASVKEATTAQRELTAAVASNNRANAEQVAYLRATADAARQDAVAMGEATAAERAMRDAALRNAEAMNVQATAASRAAASASREGAAQLQAGRAAVESADKHKAGMEKVKSGFNVAGAAGLAFVAVSLKLAGDFQKDTNVLVTAAGESAGALAGIREGIIKISTDTGTPLKQLTDGMYLVEKANYRGADALRVLTAAAQGAREENASLSAVTNAMTSVMTSYHLGAANSVQVMNALKTAAGESKTTMEDYAASLSTVIPIASANKIGFEQVAGAIATLTQHGTSAAEATQELSSTIRNLSSTTNSVAVSAMTRMGLSVTDVNSNIGRRGLTGTIELLSNAVMSHMGPAGLVLTKSFNQSKFAAQDVNVMLGTMQGPLRALAEKYHEGSISIGDWHKAIKGLPVDQASLAGQFATLQNKASGFNTLLRSGSPAAQTYTAAIKQMTGGAIGLNTFLQLGGENLAGFHTRVEAVNKSLRDGGKDVEGWASTQKLANVAMDRAKQSVEALMIQLGTALLPVLTKVASAVASGAQWLTHHKTAATALAIVLGTVLVGGIIAVNVALLTLAANPVTLTIMAVVAGVALLGAAVYVLWSHWNTIWTWIGHHKAYAAILAAVFPIVAALIGLVGVTKYLYDNWRTIWFAMRGVIEVSVHAVQAAIQRVAAVARVISDAFNAARTAAATALDGLVRVVEGVPGRVTSAFSGAGTWLMDAGRNIIGGLISGVTDMIKPLQDKFSWVTNMIPSWKGPASLDAVLLRPNAHLIMGGLIGGIAEREGALRSGLGRVTDIVARTTMPGFDLSPVNSLTRSVNMQSGGGAIPGGGGSGGTTVIHNHIHNHMDIDGREIHRSVQTHELQYQVRNTRSAFSR